MNKQLASVVWIEAVIAFFTPFGMSLVAGLGPFSATGILPNKIVAALILIAAFLAGGSGLKSFLSTTVSDAKDDLATPPIPHAPMPVDAAPKVP